MSRERAAITSHAHAEAASPARSSDPAARSLALAIQSGRAKFARSGARPRLDRAKRRLAEATATLVLDEQASARPRATRTRSASPADRRRLLATAELEIGLDIMRDDARKRRDLARSLHAAGAYAR